MFFQRCLLLVSQVGSLSASASLMSIGRKCIGAVPISKCKFMHLPKLGDSILHILQFDTSSRFLGFSQVMF